MNAIGCAQLSIKCLEHNHYKYNFPTIGRLPGYLKASMDIVVDIECFSGGIIKELAFANSYFCAGVSFKPPFPEHLLSTEEVHQNKWITNNLHKLAWNSGQFYYTDLKDVIKYIKIDNRNAEYFAKGCEKVQILTALLGIPFTNLDNLGCPSIKHLDRGNQTRCDAYPNLHFHPGIHHCAQKKAKAYYDWLSGQKLIDEFEKIELSYDTQ